MYQLDIMKFERARLKTGKTLKELGIDPNTLVRARKGRELRAQTLVKIASALDVDVLEIVKGGDAD